MNEVALLRVQEGEPPDAGTAFFQVEFKSNLEAGRHAVESALEALRHGGYLTGKRDEFRSWLCLEELVTNAIRHGNRFAPEKVGTLALFSQQDGWLARVEDQGAGFDPRRLPDPLQNLTDDHGRGVFLVCSLVEDVVFYRGGRCVQFEVRPSEGSTGDIRPLEQKVVVDSAGPERADRGPPGSNDRGRPR